MRGLQSFKNYISEIVDENDNVELLEKCLDLDSTIRRQERKLKDEIQRLKRIKMPISEIADKYSICRLKEERAAVDMSEEMKIYEEEINKYNGSIWNYVNRLYDINGEIWYLEADIRSGREGELGLEEVGRRALKIRDWNRKRVAIKNEIVELFGEGFKDIKVNHASEK